jgi:hypothetical protein
VAPYFFFLFGSWERSNRSPLVVTRAAPSRSLELMDTWKKKLFPQKSIVCLRHVTIAHLTVYMDVIKAVKWIPIGVSALVCLYRRLDTILSSCRPENQYGVHNRTDWSISQGDYIIFDFSF